MDDHRETTQDGSPVDAPDRERYLELVPEPLRDRVIELMERLVEVRLDFGTAPTALLTNGKEIELTDKTTELEEIEAIGKSVGPFNTRNRAAVDGALHRISCIRTNDGDLTGM